MTASHRLRVAGYCGRGARSSSLIGTTAEQGAFMHFVLTAALVIAGASVALAQPTSPNGVKTLSPEGAIKPTGTWALGTRAGDFVYVAGMRGIDPKTNTLVQGDEARVRQAFLNMKLIAESEGASLHDAVRIVVYVTDMFRYRPIVNKVQEELWGRPPYPPRTIVEVDRLNQDDIMEVEGTFYAPAKK
jgi:2-iminobutanoate/2-iminopropanoate deaminase